MNVLLVDDQEKILKATKQLVSWEKIGVSEVYTAGNAAAARKVLASQHVDVILLDIEMPGENGLELQKWIQDNYPDAATIFLTSHADFQYAQEALRNGAMDYILQPATFPEIERIVGKCIRDLERRRQILRKSTQYDQSQGDILKNHVLAMFHQKDQFKAMETWKRDTSTEGGEYWYLPCLIKTFAVISSESELNLQTQMEKAGIVDETILCACARLSDTELGCILYGNDVIPDLTIMKERFWNMCEQISERHHFELNLYIGQFSKDDLGRQIGKIVEFMDGHILKRNKVYLVEDSIPKMIRKPDSITWSRWLIRRDTTLLMHQISNLIRYAQEEQNLTISYMRMLIHAFLEACSIACYEQKIEFSALFDERFTYEQMLNTWSSVEKLEKGVDRILRQYLRLVCADGEQSAVSSSERVQEVLYYLEENMDRMISRREAAKYVFLNEDYFSRVFRKETGMGYKEYVLKQKVDYAKKLLKDTDMPVVMIASKTGYENYTNFIQMFRKMTGQTPTEYRKKNRSSLNPD